MEEEANVNVFETQQLESIVPVKQNKKEKQYKIDEQSKKTKVIKGVIESKDPKLTSSDSVEKNRVHKSEDSKPKGLEFERQNKVEGKEWSEYIKGFRNINFRACRKEYSFRIRGFKATRI